MYDWWSSIIGTVVGFLTAWSVLQLTEYRRGKRAQAVTRRAIVAELRHSELILSSTIVNLSILKNGRARAIRFTTLASLCEVLSCQPGDLLSYQPDGNTREGPSGAPSR